MQFDLITCMFAMPELAHLRIRHAFLTFARFVLHCV